MRYTITIAASNRGKYHISEYEPPLVPRAAWSEEEPQRFTPLCRTRVEQRYNRWSEADEDTVAKVWRVFTQQIHHDLTCDKCEHACWPLINVEAETEEE